MGTLVMNKKVKIRELFAHSIGIAAVIAAVAVISVVATRPYI